MDETLQSGLKAWADRNNLNASVLAETLGYSYQHTWRLLNGTLPVNDAVLGRILIKFGANAAAEIAGQTEQD